MPKFWSPNHRERGCLTYSRGFQCGASSALGAAAPSLPPRLPLSLLQTQSGSPTCLCPAGGRESLPLTQGQGSQLDCA